MKTKYDELAEKFLADRKIVNREDLDELDLKQLYLLAKRNFDQFIDTIEKNTVLDKHLNKVKKISIPNLKNIEQVKIVLNVLAKKSLADSTTIEFDKLCDVSELDIINIESSYKLNINFLKIDSRKKLLIKNFIKSIENEYLSNLSVTIIKSKIEEACKQAKSTDGIIMNTTQASRYLNNIDFLKINSKFGNINQFIQEIYKNEQVKSEFYHLEQAEDKHFYMVKVTGKNAQQWRSYISKQENHQEKDSDNKSLKNVGTGHTGFMPMLKYHDQDLTDVWVAFFASKKIIDSNNVNFKDIEIAVTVDTSKNSTFISPTGIARNVNYEGAEHKNLAPEFFSCIAKIMQKHYTEEHNLVSKIKLINQPAAVMQQILIKNFNSIDSFFVGDSRDMSLGHIEHQITLEKILKRQEILISNGITERNKYKYHKNIIAIELNKQAIAIEKNKKYMPIIVKGDDSYNGELGIFEKDFLYIIYNKKGDILQSIDANQAKGEYSWYFESPFLYVDSNDARTISADLDDVAKYLPQNNPIKHWSQIEPIGDAPIYHD